MPFFIFSSFSVQRVADLFTKYHVFDTEISELLFHSASSNPIFVVRR